VLAAAQRSLLRDCRGCGGGGGSSSSGGSQLLLNGGLAHLRLLAALEAFLAAQVATILEHAPRVWVQSPEAALSGLVGRSRHLDETVVEGERVSD